MVIKKRVQYYEKIIIFANKKTKTMKKTTFLLTALLLLITSPLLAQRHFAVDLWQAKAPNKNSLGDTARVYVYLPNEKTATGRAVVIMPGGGYESLSMGHEGIDWAPFFNNQGIAAIVLQYRMPAGNAKVPVSDAEEALRTVRRNAKAWHIDTNDVGVMGFSAGGHLASTIATQSKDDAKPNFQILFYPVITMLQGYCHQGSRDNLLGKNPRKKDEQKYCSDLQVSRMTPRAFIALSDDDHVVEPMNGVNYYTELYRHDVPASLHVYPDGGHGYGLRTDFRYHIEMLLDLKAWLQSF